MCADDVIQRYAPLNPGGLCVDLGCGFYKPAGFIGIDNLVGANAQIQSDNMPDILIDLDRATIPLPDNSCVEIRASHFLEHSNVPHILNETHRLLKPAGVFMFAVPYANSAEGMYPGHHIFFTEKWFHLNIQFQKQFKIEKIDYQPSDTYEKEMPENLKALIPFDVARKFMFNVCNQMTVTATVNKV